MYLCDAACPILISGASIDEIRAHPVSAKRSQSFAQGHANGLQDDVQVEFTRDIYLGLESDEVFVGRHHTQPATRKAEAYFNTYKYGVRNIRNSVESVRKVSLVLIDCQWSFKFHKIHVTNSVRQLTASGAFVERLILSMETKLQRAATASLAWKAAAASTAAWLHVKAAVFTTVETAAREPLKTPAYTATTPRTPLRASSTSPAVRSTDGAHKVRTLV